jgi:predicted dehydrogenase
VRLKASFFVREANPAYTIHGKKGSFLKPRGDIQEDELKLGNKPNQTTWGTESDENQGLLHTEMDRNVIKEKIRTLQGNYYAFFEGVYQAIVHDAQEPVTAQDGVQVMQVIEAIIQSSQEGKVMHCL